MNEGVKLSCCAYVKLSRLAFTGCYGNGLNIDHGGRNDTPSHHIVLESLTIRDTGTRANHDAIKLAGVDHFLVTGCHIEGWGARVSIWWDAISA